MALIAAFREILGGKQPEFSQEADRACRHDRRRREAGAAYRALALTLPGEADIARDIGKNIDPDAIYRGREALAQAIAQANRPAFSRRSTHCACDKAAFSPDAASAGRRALRNTLLDYLSHAAGRSGACRQAFPVGDQHDRPRRSACRARASPPRFAARRSTRWRRFETRYGADPLVMDKWFQIQAERAGPRRRRHGARR